MTRGHTVTRQTGQILANDLRTRRFAYERQRAGRRPIAGEPSPVIHFKSKVGGIPAISTLTMGSASCDKYDCDSSGVLSDSGDDVTIYNMAGAFAANTLGVAALNEQGLYVAIVEKC